MNFYELLTAPTHAFHSFLIFYRESQIIETHFTMSRNKRCTFAGGFNVTTIFYAYRYTYRTSRDDRGDDKLLYRQEGAR